MIKPWNLSKDGMREAIFRIWPDLSNARFEWIYTGWDFHVAMVNRQWVVRIARTHSDAWRLRREIGLLSALPEPPVPVPHYDRWTHGVGLYPYIPGRALRPSRPAPLTVRSQIGEFIDWLHGQTQPNPRVDVRRRWRRRYAALFRRIEKESLHLFSVKEVRRIRDRFARGMAQVELGGWRVAILHGDLVPEHVVTEGDQVKGIIDFGDWQWGDEAFDWAGIPGMEAALPSSLASDPNFRDRVKFYRFCVPFHQISQGLHEGQVETVERSVRQVRRLLAE